ncbi:ABC transporter permease [Treponema lecithinolyticum]|jgi:Ribose/xylose/arabinose/galactoside ABC-type transport systems, permease components|uniref:Ribose ABC transporter permease protein n=2 Tax=Treponema lecithinolyticum TaxID=53418 RepID=A0ABN0NW61_TRELE|nr:ABC transporter permease [Treponema lecithinolyticum]ERJ91553.1 ribose ABC transporter permease protein [Treponema lecithinolyticum ATCC 700332]
MQKTINAAAVKKIFSAYSLYILLLVLIIVVSVLNTNFLSAQNIKNIFQQVSINGILAVGMTFVIITGGIDLSVGSLLGFSGVIAASLVSGGGNPLLAVLAGIAAGLVFGVVNGVLVSYAKIVPFIVTLGMLSIARGFTNVYTHGSPIIKLNKAFTALGQSSFLGIGLPVWIFVCMLLVGYVLLHTTKLGRYTLAVGGNESAAKTSGINTAKIKMFAYTFTGFCCGLAGILMTAKTNAGAPNAGTGYELDAIAAAIIGGTSPSGGKGSIFGTLLGVLIFGIIQNALDILNVSSYIQQVIKGLIIIGAVWADKANRRFE